MPTYNLLKKTKIQGLGPIEDFILVALVTGDPVIFISDPGSAKTLFVTNLSSLLGYNKREVCIMSAPMMVYEDVVGMPVPKQGSEGEWELDFAKTEASVWGKKVLFIDEVNRCEVDTQNLMLQLIQDRKCLGKELNLHYVFAAQNELTERGTKPLSNAIADRFSLFIPFPKYENLKNEEKRNVLTMRGFQDSPLLNRNEIIHQDDTLIKFLDTVRDSYDKSALGTEEFTLSVVDFLNNNGFKLSGRRAHKIATNVKTLLLIRKLKMESSFNLKDEKALTEIIYYSIPKRVTDLNPIDQQLIRKAVMGALTSLIDSTSPVASYFTLRDALKITAKAISDYNVNADSSVLSEVIEHALNMARQEDIDLRTDDMSVGPREMAISSLIMVDSKLRSKLERKTLDRAMNAVGPRSGEYLMNSANWLESNTVDQFAVGNRFPTHKTFEATDSKEMDRYWKAMFANASIIAAASDTNVDECIRTIHKLKNYIINGVGEEDE